MVEFVQSTAGGRVWASPARKRRAGEALSFTEKPSQLLSGESGRYGNFSISPGADGFVGRVSIPDIRVQSLSGLESRPAYRESARCVIKHLIPRAFPFTGPGPVVRLPESVADSPYSRLPPVIKSIHSFTRPLEVGAESILTDRIAFKWSRRMRKGQGRGATKASRSSILFALCLKPDPYYRNRQVLVKKN